MIDKINLVLHDDNVEIKYRSDGVEVVRSVSVPNLIAAVENRIVIRTGILGTGVREYALRGHESIFTVEFPPKIRPLHYVTREQKHLHFMVPWPAMVFVFYLSNGKLQNTWCFATKEPLWNRDIDLFLFPYGNADSDGRVCWGISGSPREEFYSANITTLGRMFIESPFNNHLSNNSFISPSGIKKITRAIELIQFLEGKDKFPFEVLKRYETYNEKMTEIFGRFNF